MFDTQPVRVLVLVLRVLNYFENRFASSNVLLLVGFFDFFAVVVSEMQASDHIAI